MDAFSQGTIIRYINSPNHPNVQCGGIVINARCDLAQKKIPRISMLSFMTLESWIYSVYFEEMLGQIKNEKYNSLSSFCKKYNLDLEILEEFGPEKAKIAIDKCEAKKTEKDSAIEKLDSIKVCDEYIITPPTNIEKKDMFMVNKSKLNNKLQELHNSKITRYCFVPKKGYIKELNVLNDGIVIDLHDIIQISYTQFMNACNGKIDCRQMKQDEIEKASEVFSFFDFDFVLVQKDYCVISPWIEHVLQQFALAFSRIGVENATKMDIQKYCEAWSGGE